METNEELNCSTQRKRLYPNEPEFYCCRCDRTWQGQWVCSRCRQMGVVKNRRIMAGANTRKDFERKGQFPCRLTPAATYRSCRLLTAPALTRVQAANRAVEGKG